MKRATGLTHFAGHRWLVVCTANGTGREWVIDGAPERAAAEARLLRWEGRSAGEWNGEYAFRIEEATQ